MTITLSPRLIVLLPLLLAACDRPQEKPEAADADTAVAPTEALPVAAMDFTTEYRCPDGSVLSVNYRDNQVIVQFPDEELTLPQTVSASGARYSDETTTVWSKGRDLLVELPGQEQQSCSEIDATATAN